MAHREISHLLGELVASIEIWRSNETSVFAALSASCHEPFETEYKVPAEASCIKIATLSDRIKSTAERLFLTAGVDPHHPELALITKQILDELRLHGGVELETQAELQAYRDGLEYVDR